MPRLVALTLLVGCTTTALADLRMVAESHRASLDSYRQLSVRLQIEYLSEAGKVEEASTVQIEWEQEGEDFSCRYNHAGIPTHQVFRGNRFKTLQIIKMGKDITHSGIIAAKPPVPLSEESPWGQGLFRVRQREPLAFIDVLDEGRRPAEVTGVKVTEGRLVEVSFNATFKGKKRPPVKHQVTFDPGKNYLATAATSDRDGYRTESKVVSFAEPIPGIYFPEIVEHRARQNGKQVYWSRVTFRDIRINSGIDATAFDIRFPEGTDVSDSIQGLMYTVGKDEQPVGPTSPLVTPGALGRELDGPPSPHSRTWRAVVAVLALGLAACLLLALALQWRKNLVLRSRVQ